MNTRGAQKPTLRERNCRVGQFREVRTSSTGDAHLSREDLAYGATSFSAFTSTPKEMFRGNTRSTAYADPVTDPTISRNSPFARLLRPPYRRGCRRKDAPASDRMGRFLLVQTDGYPLC